MFSDIVKIGQIRRVICWYSWCSVETTNTLKIGTHHERHKGRKTLTALFLVNYCNCLDVSHRKNKVYRENGLRGCMEVYVVCHVNRIADWCAATLVSNNGDIHMTNCTVIYNTCNLHDDLWVSSYAGGIRPGTNHLLNNNIVYGNVAEGAASDDPGPVNGTGNLIDIDLMLLPLDYYGGTTRTHALVTVQGPRSRMI